MQQKICGTCGGALERKGDYYCCRFCGNKWVVDVTDDLRFVDRANAWSALRSCDFERACELFENILFNEPENHEAYWGRALSYHGIIYVTDLNENKRVPTCNNIGEDSFVDCADVKKAIAYAPADIGESYREQARLIEDIRIEWLDKARKEPPYDIFLCYKDSDAENGIDRTEDSVVAQDIYIHLKEQGYRVFYSRESLRDKIGEKYEPYIYNALATSKVMLVYGSSSRYIKSAWLKNEWYRYSRRIASGEKHKDSLIVACDGFSPSELPLSLASRQCLDASRKTFFIDMDRSISRIISECNEKNNETVAENIESEQKNAENIAAQSEEPIPQAVESTKDIPLKTVKAGEVFPFGKVFSNYAKYLKYTFSKKRTLGHKFRLLSEFLAAIVFLLASIDSFFNISSMFEGASVVFGFLAVFTIVFAVITVIKLSQEKRARKKMEKQLVKQSRYKFVRSGCWISSNILLVLGVAFIFGVDSTSMVVSIIAWGLYLAYISFCPTYYDEVRMFKKITLPKAVLIAIPIVVTIVSILIFG